jgi:preprotein translocase subunit SecY
MTLKTLFVINATICLVFGLAFVLAPVQVISLFGSEAVSDQFKYVSQLFGSTLLAFGFISWTARKSADSTARNALVLSFFVGDLVGFVVSLTNQIGGVVKTLNWVTVVLYLLLAICFGYFYLTKPD